MAGQPAFFNQTFMKKHFTFLIILCLAISCHTKKQVADKKTADAPANKTVAVTPTGNGTSIADAVVIVEEKSEQEIWVKEQAWLAARYPGYVILSTRQENGNSQTPKLYNIHKIRTPDAAEFEVFFDVSFFYNSQTK